MADASGDQGGAIEGQMGMEEVGGEKRPRNGQTAGSATRAKRGRPFQSQTKKMESARKKKEEKEYVSSHRAVLLNGSSLDDCGCFDDHLDKTGLLLVFFLFKSRLFATTTRAQLLCSLYLGLGCETNKQYTSTSLLQLYFIPKYNIKMVFVYLIYTIMGPCSRVHVT